MAARSGFIRELVPRIAIAVTARVFYGEPYLALPMRSEVGEKDGIVRAKYEWRRRKNWEWLAISGQGAAQDIREGSHEEFISEHYWGYTARGGRTSEYQVEHPRWKTWPADSFEFNAEVATLYGEKFVATFAAAPRSAFVADGSIVSVFAQDRELSS